MSAKKSSGGRKSSAKKKKRTRTKQEGPGSSGPSVARHLVIVESPTKRKAISKFLGSDFQVMATSGHFRTLFANTPFKEPPQAGIFEGYERGERYELKGAARAQVEAFLEQFPTTRGSKPLSPETNPGRYLAVNVEQGYDPYYAITNFRVAQELVKEAKALKRGGVIYIATDPDREGEGIGWHVLEILRLNEAIPSGVEVRRARFHAVTREDVAQAIEEADDLHPGLVGAYRAREILDRLIGYPASRGLWATNLRPPSGYGGLSLGRVQFAALSMLMGDEEVSLQTLPTIKYEVRATAVVDGEEFPVRFTTERPVTDPDQLEEALNSEPATVESFKQGEKTQGPWPAFHTASFQTDIHRRHGIRAKDALRVLQQLFDSGSITYPRTDSRAFSPEGFREMRSVARDIGVRSISSPRSSVKATAAQEAHEAIRPKRNAPPTKDLTRAINDGKDFTKMTVKSHFGNKLDSRELKAFELIYRRSIANVMPNAKIDERKVALRHPALGDEALLSGESGTYLDPGFFEVWTYERGDTPFEIPALEEGEEVQLKDAEVKVNVTNPPRPSAQGLIGRLEKAGIGRPSSTASMIDLLERRGYVQEGKGLSRFGAFVTQLSQESLGESVTLDTTSQMDQGLSNLREEVGSFEEMEAVDGPVSDLLDVFYDPFRERLPYLRDLSFKLGREIRQVPGFLGGRGFNRFEGITGVKSEEDGELLTALQEYQPNVRWWSWGSLVFLRRRLDNEGRNGLLLLVWQDKKGVRARLFWLYMDGDTPMTFMLSGKVEGVRSVGQLMDQCDWATRRLRQNPVMDFSEAWDLYFELWREGRKAFSKDLLFEVGGSFPLFRRAVGDPNKVSWTAHELTFGTKRRS